ncbi:23S rRNA pseudouridine2605 synthase [Promicromonospora umidemergens]|uniref:Pseudouridine synthase n=1 Tax=Promicromonospora umidemergens TaxID=629679 RepID=A0ABP8WYI2_9MICO|nr:pseudouridine synthase [Promicromonospora umidemergens]MCP2285730.1 23S rRNA pseudouridine2605 synthase [Promicromonospora umidemergens]
MSNERRGGSRRESSGGQQPRRPDHSGKQGAKNFRGGSSAKSRAQANAPRRKPAQPAEQGRDVHVEGGVRLQKVLAQAGLGSRRASEELIAKGHVEVDGQVVTELGVRIDPDTAVVHVDGLRIQLDQAKVTIALNKPLGVVSTMDDPKGRPTVADLIKNREERLFHVGRLDADSEGLLLLTNDGELANRLSHPKYEIAKTYLVTVEGEIFPRVGKQLLKGVELDDGIVKMDAVHVVQQIDGFAMLEVVLHEGRNRIVRRMFEAVGHPVTRLVRTRIGPIPLGDLKSGRTRVLGRTELGTLMGAVDL